jgi:uncharacterized membrane protein YcaP (DUF421 family)
MLDELWRNLMTLGNADTVTWLEKIVRPVIVYVALLFLLKIFGKRELAQLNPFDLVVLLILSNTVQNAIIGNDTSLAGGLVGAAILLVMNWIVVHYFYQHQKLDEFFEGEPHTLVKDGQRIEDACRQEQITDAELLAAIRKQGFAGLSEVKEVVLETGGAISVIPKEPTSDTKIDDILARLQRIEQVLGTAPAHAGGS